MSDSDDELTGCICRWNGEEQVRFCALHEAWRDAIHDWAERAKEAEALLRTREVIAKASKEPS